MASRSMHFDDVAERSDLVTINVQEAVNDEALELGIVKVTAMSPTPAEAFPAISTMKPIPLEGTLAHCHVNPANMSTVPIYSLGKKKQSEVNVEVERFMED